MKIYFEPIYKEASELVRHQEQLLFQRFNYFLLSTSFLLIGFITLAVNTINWIGVTNSTLMYLAYFMCAVGIFFSWVFTAINLRNSHILNRFYEYVEKLEDTITENGKWLEMGGFPYQI